MMPSKSNHIFYVLLGKSEVEIESLLGVPFAKTEDQSNLKSVCLYETDNGDIISIDFCSHISQQVDCVHERRKGYRTKLFYDKKSVFVFLEEHCEPIKGEAINISQSGIAVKLSTSTILSKGILVRLCIELCSQKITLHAQMHRVDNSNIYVFLFDYEGALPRHSNLFVAEYVNKERAYSYLAIPMASRSTSQGRSVVLSDRCDLCEQEILCRSSG